MASCVDAIVERMCSSIMVLAFSIPFPYIGCCREGAPVGDAPVKAGEVATVGFRPGNHVLLGGPTTVPAYAMVPRAVWSDGFDSRPRHAFLFQVGKVSPMPPSQLRTNPHHTMQDAKQASHHQHMRAGNVGDSAAYHAMAPKSQLAKERDWLSPVMARTGATDMRKEHEMATYEAEWTGRYPNLCMGEWKLWKDGNDVSYLIPADLRHSALGMNTAGTYPAWTFDEDWNDNWWSYEDGMDEEAWCQANHEWLQDIGARDEWGDIFQEFQKYDFRQGCCGGCI